jgi:sulfur-oxidizing protein SoxA
VGQRYTRAQLRQWVVDARVMRTDTLMPPYGTTQGLNAPARQQPLLTPAQIDAVVETLTRFTHTAPHSPASPATPVPSSTSSSVAQLQAVQDMNPVDFWVEQGRQTWQRACVSCHALDDVVKTVPTFPRLNAQRALINLEDQINRCRVRNGERSSIKNNASISAASNSHSNGTSTHDMARLSVEDRTTLSLSAFLHEMARHQPIHIAAPPDAAATARWQQHLDAGERLYNTRMGHMNLSCRQCHDDKVGAAMRAQRIPAAHPVGFPVYRISWQGLGSMDRRIRACLSGVQADIPAAQDVRLRQLELYLKIRAQGQLLEGPSLKP